MSKFRKHKKDGTPAMSTAALPDIVFMLLFFFMVGAQMVSENYHKFIELERPVADHLNILKEDQVSYYYVGRIKTGIKNPDEEGTHMIVANDKPIRVDQIPEYIQLSRKDAGAFADRLYAQFTMDGATTAEYENLIIKELQKARQLKVSYTGIEGDFASK